jgi:uncharacterized protein (TIGR03067 family)
MQRSAMRTAVIILVLGFATVLQTGAPAGAAPVPKHLMKAPDNSEEAQLQGQWKLEALDVGKMPLQGVGPQQMQITLEFRGNKMTGNSQGRAVSATIKLDRVDGIKHLAMTNTQAVDGTGKPVKEDDVTFGYCIDGDKLTLATTLEGKTPVDPTKAGNNALVLIFTRVKEKN